LVYIFIAVGETLTDSSNSYTYKFKEEIKESAVKLVAHAETHQMELNDPQFKKKMVEARKWLFQEIDKVNSTKTLAKARLKQGFSQIQLAEKIGTSQAHIARIESGAEVKISTASKIAKELKITLDEFEILRKNSMED